MKLIKKKKPIKLNKKKKPIKIGPFPAQSWRGPKMPTLPIWARKWQKAKKLAKGQV
jgi:hypothetical protein